MFDPFLVVSVNYRSGNLFNKRSFSSKNAGLRIIWMAPDSATAKAIGRILSEAEGYTRISVRE